MIIVCPCAWSYVHFPVSKYKAIYHGSDSRQTSQRNKLKIIQMWFNKQTCEIMYIIIIISVALQS
jgi:hypothetical protein